MESTRGWIGGPGATHLWRQQTGSGAGGETMAFGCPLTRRLKGKRLGGEAQNGGGEKESVRGEKAPASLGGKKGRKGRAGRRGEETLARGGGEGWKPSLPRRELWRRKHCGASSQGRTRGVGDREADADRRYLFCPTLPVTARATLQACLCASFF